jgi:hypothetical protein
MNRESELVQQVTPPTRAEQPPVPVRKRREEVSMSAFPNEHDKSGCERGL